MPARGEEAQAEKARQKAEKRAAKESVREQGEDGEFNVAWRDLFDAFRVDLDTLLYDFRAKLQGTMRESLSRRTKRLKGENERLREAEQQAQSLAESRRLELDGQVARARSVESELERFKKARALEEEKLRLELARQMEIIEEQASTIKAQAKALRAAEKAIKV